MAITGGRFNEMWAQYFDGAHGYSVNVQGRGVGAICEVTLISHWGSGSVTGSDISVTGSDIFITQSISAIDLGAGNMARAVDHECPRHDTDGPRQRY
jgi:hypothetical protein